MLIRPRRLVIAVAVSAIALLAPAQCPTPGTWTALDQSPAPTGSVYAMARWDPDGPGPLGVQVVCGGAFAYAGAAATANIALYDPVARAWSPLGAGFDAPVRALAVLANGDLVAGGDFLQSGGTPTAGLARWNGSAWLPLGTGVSGTPSLPFPLPPDAPPVGTLAVRSNGDLVVGGLFATAGGMPANGLATWNPSGWSAIALPAGNMLTALRTLANGDVLIGYGNGLDHFVGRWNGSAWTAVGASSQTPWSSLVELANGTLLAGRSDYFSALGEVLQWTGGGWAAYGPQAVLGPPTTLLELGAGDLLIAGPQWVRGVATVQRLTNGAFAAAAPGLDGWIEDVHAVDDQVVIGGWFSQVGATPARGVAVLANGIWSPLGGGLDGPVYDVLRLRDGDLVAAGYFTQAGAVAADSIARWTGSQWQAIGSPPIAIVQAATETSNGDIVIAGGYPPQAARWNGSGWSQLGNFPQPSLSLLDVATLPNGDIVVACSYGAGALVWRWDGSLWSPLGNAPTGSGWYEAVERLLVTSGGELLAAGYFTLGTPSQTVTLARWDGITWTSVPSAPAAFAHDVDELPNGDLLLTHDAIDFSGAAIATPSRWNGSSWTALPGVTFGAGQTAGQLAIRDTGDLVLTGTFEAVQGAAAGGLARYATACPATVVAAGAGCAGSAGAVVTTVTARAWLGSAYRAQTTGLPALSLAVHVYGLQSVSLAIASVLPQGLPGCTLHVSPDVLAPVLPSGGATTTTLVIPSTVTLIGQSFRHQVVPFELAPTGAITAISSSNALQLAIGAW